MELERTSIIETMPDLVLDEIVSFLSYSDLVNFSATCKTFSQFKPRIQRITNEGFQAYGPNEGHFWPETYMDVPVLTRGLKSVNMEATMNKDRVRLSNQLTKDTAALLRT